MYAELSGPGSTVRPVRPATIPQGGTLMSQTVVADERKASFSQVVSHPPDPRRWLALFVIAIAQRMVVLDASIVNIAMPSAQAELGIADADRQWIVTAYTL